jgi:SAM-dependent methyltransferase
MTMRPTTAPYAKYAATAAENYDRYFVPAIGEPVARRLLDAARPAPGERVLDVACGTGIAARLAFPAVRPEGTVTGLDANPGCSRWHATSALRPSSGSKRRRRTSRCPMPRSTWCCARWECSSSPTGTGRCVRCTACSRPAGAPHGARRDRSPPLFDAIDRALANHLGPGASMFVHAVFSLHDADEARDLMDAAGFDHVRVDASPVPLRVAPPADFVWQYVQSTPLAAAAADLDDAERAALEAEVVERCAQFVDDDAAVMQPGLLIATASRGIR